MAGLLGSVDSALARAGDLSFAACISGDVRSTPAGTGPCVASPTSTANGAGSGLDGSTASAVSPDGKNVYVVAEADDALIRFSRHAVTGALSYRDCFSGDTNLVAACKLIPGATAGGVDSGLDQPASVTISPNGRSVYIGSKWDSAVARFSRATAQGALTYSGCISGKTASACTHIPAATPLAANSGLAIPTAVVASPDGKSVYVSARGDNAVGRFNSDPSTGALTYAGCISGRTSLATACALIPAATATGEDSGLSGRFDLIGFGRPDLAISPDGQDLYLTAEDDDAVARFDRNTTTGALGYAGCLSGELESACDRIETATSFGNGSGFSFPTSIAVSPDGKSVYAGTPSEVVHFRRNASGALSFRGCVTGDSDLPGAVCDEIPTATPFGDRSGLDSVRSLSVSPDGENVYAAVSDDAAVARFNRNIATGAIRYADCLGGNSRSPCDLVDSATPGGSSSGLGGLNSLSVSSDGMTVYATPGTGVVTFGREDLSSPALRLLSPARQRSTRRIIVKASCDEPCRVVVRLLGRAEIATKRKLKVTRAKASLEANEKTKLKLKYKGRRTKRLVKRSLKRGKRITVRLRVTATDEAGNKKTKREKVKLSR